MAFSNSTNHYEEEVSDESGDCVNHRLIQQRNVRELEGEFSERDSDQHTSSSEDEKHFQFNEQRGNKQRNNKSSHYGLERGSYESDSSELSDLSHDQDSWDYKKNNRKVRIDDKNCRTEFGYSGNSHQQSDRHIVLETVEENTKTFCENSVEEKSLDQRRREESKYRRNKDNNGGKNHQSQRRLTFEDKSNSMEAPNVVITEAEVHVDHEEYRERRRKGRSDPHLYISHHVDSEEQTQHDRHSRTRSEPRRPIKRGKDEVNKAERHVHMIDNDRHRHVKQVHGSHRKEDNDVDFEVQENKRGHRESNEQRENRNREELSANRNKRQDSGEEVESGRDQKGDLRKGIRKMNSQKSESFESDSNKNEYLPSEGEQYRDRGHSEQVNMREERSRQGHGTRYYTPQLERRQNRRGKGELLSHVSEDDLSEAVIRDREHTRFAPVVKAKNMKDVKTVRNQYAEEDFSMPNNKLGSFQDFKPLAKTPSVSRISNTYGKRLHFCFNPILYRLFLDRDIIFYS